jgi:hypothetical protein
MAASSARTPPPGRRSADSRSGTREGYASRSIDPLHILLFLTPLVAFYEATIFFSGLSGVQDTVAAHELINRFLRVFGDFALYLPGIVLIGTLLLMKFHRGDAWAIRLGTLPLMAVESVVWAIPMLVIAALLSTPPAVAVSSAEPLASLPLLSRIALSIGAGLYEELLFRLLLVSAGAMALRSIFRLSDTLAAGLAIAAAALAFTFYHQPGDPATLIARRLLYFVAGCFLGLVFVLRGFGIVVGAHAVYDLCVLVLLRADMEA